MLLLAYTYVRYRFPRSLRQWTRLQVCSSLIQAHTTSVHGVSLHCCRWKIRDLRSLQGHRCRILPSVLPMAALDIAGRTGQHDDGIEVRPGSISQYIRMQYVLKSLKRMKLRRLKTFFLEKIFVSTMVRTIWDLVGGPLAALAGGPTRLQR